MTSDVILPAPPPKPLMRVSGGQPNMPAGEPEFVPLNPWGRGFPKDLIRRPVYPQRFQVVVRDRRDGNKEVRVGPKINKEFAEMFCKAIEQQIGSGAERRWANPIVIPVS